MGSFKSDQIEKVKAELFVYLKDADQINNLCKIYYYLKDKGFEYYIGEYLSKLHGFDITVQGGYNDKGIDIIGKRIINGIEQRAYIQCKQWHWNSKKWHITENVLSNFIGKTYKLKNDSTFLYVITTSWFTPGAKKFAEENKIIIKDYRNLAREISYKFKFEEFVEIILNKNNDKLNNIIFENNYLEKITGKNNEIKDIKKKTKNDLKILYKEVQKYVNPNNFKTKIIYFVLGVLSLILIITIINFNKTPDATVIPNNNQYINSNTSNEITPIRHKNIKTRKH